MKTPLEGYIHELGGQITKNFHTYEADVGRDNAVGLAVAWSVAFPAPLAVSETIKLEKLVREQFNL